MSKSKIVLALFAGIVIGGVIVYSTSQNQLKNDDDEIDNTPDSLDNISKQFAAKISSELKAAEKKIKTVVKKEIDGIAPEREMGLFL